jgi:hypothetical protein
MHVKETIAYDFAGSAYKHGIWRKILDDFPYDDQHHRVYPITNVDVTSPDASADTETEDGSAFGIKIGDKDETVSGVKHYVISYDVGGVVNSFSDHQELYWNAIGTEWSVPVASAKVIVEGPAGIQKVACFAGFQGSTNPCASQLFTGDRATFTARNLQPSQAMSVVASFPAKTFPNAAPILREPWSVTRAFSALPLQAGTAVVALLALIAGAVRLMLRHGRDEQYLGQIPGLAPGLGQQENVQRRPVFGRTPVAVQFQPPKGMRPGQLGTLIDEQANVVDVTATIVDLAVRGLLRIEEIQQPGFFRGGDWKLVRLRSDAPAEPQRPAYGKDQTMYDAETARPSSPDGLYGYEATLLNAIFAGREEVLLSDLKQTFRSDLQKVQNLLYADVTEHGWFRGNPNSVRRRWQFLGLLAIAAGAGLTYLLARWTSFGLTGLAVVLAGVVLLAMSPRMPARTAKGTAALSQARGFRMYLETAEAEQLRFEEGEDLFSRYLPYAIVFGVAERWAKVFARLAASGAAVATPTWYVSSNPAFYGGGFDYNGFGGSMDSFANVTSGSLAAATPSSSGSSGFGGGGFSGGGGGGGGGGSW